MDMPSKGATNTVPTNPMGSGIVAGNTAPFPEAPQLNPIQQIGNLVAQPQTPPTQQYQTPAQQSQEKLLKALTQQQSAPVQSQPVQFASSSGNGQQLANFLKSLMQNQSGSTNGY